MQQIQVVKENEKENENVIIREEICLRLNQAEVLEDVAKILNKSLSQYITDAVLAFVDMDIDETVRLELKKRFAGGEEEVKKEQ